MRWFGGVIEKHLKLLISEGSDLLAEGETSA